MGYKISNDQIYNDRGFKISKLQILKYRKLSNFLFTNYFFHFKNEIVKFEKYLILLFGK